MWTRYGGTWIFGDFSLWCYDKTVLPGFNHNLRHEGMLFHVQTEDNGLDNPIVITHVFVGGDILATRRTSYEKFRFKETVREIVLAIMREQHKEIMKDLVHGRIASVQEKLGKPKVFKEETVVSKAARRPPRSPTSVPTLDTTDIEEKTLDELIIEFLASGAEPAKKK